MKEFVGVIIVWIAPWFGIMIVDWILRRYRYNAAELQRRDSGSIYYAGKSGVNWNAIIAFVAGSCARPWPSPRRRHRSISPSTG